jgi:hypothetical protein
VVTVVAVLAAAALVLPPFINVSRYKGKVIDSMSRALGRPVSVDSVSLRLLPRPGFVLENVVVGDDPLYSAEPLLHADEVTAYIGASSLWRGRLDVTRLSLRYPSLNLVEQPGVGWNLESLLWRAQRTQAAPTGAGATSGRTRFPYIDATNGRINFKYGMEKSFFSFTEAAFVLYSPSENQWRMRLDAHPVRTDMPITDTGIIKAQVDIQRAPMLRDAPMKGTLTWERVQLGNLTRLLYGEDRGWRGALHSSLQLTGTPAAMQFTVATRLQDFRRYDVASADALDLNATCYGTLELANSSLTKSECRLPLGEGALTAKGRLQGLRHPRYDLTLAAEDIPAASLLKLLRHAKGNLPSDLSATGRLDASFHSHREGDQPPEWTGSLTGEKLVLRSSVLGKELALGRIVATVNTNTPQPAPRSKKHAAAIPTVPVRALVLQPVELPLGAAAPATVQGLFDDKGFGLHLKGEATLERLQQFARALGIGAPKIAVSGPATLDLTLGGPWSEQLVAPEVGGSAQLHSARVEVPGLLLPVEIASARVDFDGRRFTLRNASASVGKVALTGQASFPRACTPDAPCEATLELATDELNPERWNEVLNPKLKKQPWYGLFGSGDQLNLMANLHASGRLTARRVALDTLTTGPAESDFTIASGVLELTGLRAALLGGTLSGGGKLDFSADPPRYELTGEAKDLSLEKLAAATRVALGNGNLSASYKLTLSGWDEAALLHNSAAEGDFTWTGGALRFSPEGHGPMRVLNAAGHLTLGPEGWSISASHWKSPAAVYQLSGSIQRNSELALEFKQQNGDVWKLAGPLAKPVLGSPVPQPTQARRR